MLKSSAPSWDSLPSWSERLEDLWKESCFSACYTSPGHVWNHATLSMMHFKLSARKHRFGEEGVVVFLLSFTVFPEMSHMGILTPKISGCDMEIQSLRGNWVKIEILGCAFIQSDGFPYEKRKLDTDTDRRTPWRRWPSTNWREGPRKNQHPGLRTSSPELWENKCPLCEHPVYMLCYGNPSRSSLGPICSSCQGSNFWIATSETCHFSITHRIWSLIVSGKMGRKC